MDERVPSGDFAPFKWRAPGKKREQTRLEHFYAPTQPSTPGGTATTSHNHCTDRDGAIRAQSPVTLPDDAREALLK